jgi:hypothetical protein
LRFLRRASGLIWRLISANRITRMVGSGTPGFRSQRESMRQPMSGMGR